MTILPRSQDLPNSRHYTGWENGAMLCLTDLHTEQIRARAKVSSNARSRQVASPPRAKTSGGGGNENVTCVCTPTNPHQRLQRTSLLREMGKMADGGDGSSSAVLHEQGYVVKFFVQSIDLIV